MLLCDQQPPPRRVRIHLPSGQQVGMTCQQSLQEALGLVWRDLHCSQRILAVDVEDPVLAAHPRTVPYANRPGRRIGASNLELLAAGRYMRQVGCRCIALPFTEGPKRACQGEPDARVANNLMASLVARMAVPNAKPRSSRQGLNVPSPVPSA